MSMSYDSYREYETMFQDIKDEVSENGYSTSSVESAKSQVKKMFRDLYATYGREDYYVKILRDFMSWYL